MELRTICYWVATGWTMLIAVLCLTGSGEVPEWSFYQVDKLVHFAFYFLFTVLWFIGLNLRRFDKVLLVKIAIIGTIYGVVIELLQYSFTNTRHADVDDVIANSVGILAGSIFLIIRDRNAK